MPVHLDSPDPRPPRRKAARKLRRFVARDGRDHLWAFLDLLDGRPALRKILLIGVPALVIAVGLGAWGYKHWARSNAVRIARQWLDAGRLDQAGIAIQNAVAAEPGLPDPWRLASELAWRKGNRAASVGFAKRAAALGGYRAGDVLAWAEASILSDDAEQAREAEVYLDPKAQASTRALRLAGEIARRAGRFEEARGPFQAALEEDAKTGAPSSLAVDEVPLGIVCLQTGSAEDRSRGQTLLAKWAPDPKWGAEALRALLADAVSHGDRGQTSRWAGELRVHPLCTLADIPVCLKALAGSDLARYQAMLRPLEDNSRSVATQAAQLLGWLTQIGQGEEAVRWGESLDPASARKPPIAPGIAEALRSTHRWADLQAWVDGADWGRDLEFLGRAYGMVAARELGDGPRADSLWSAVHADGGMSPAHALFAGESLYAWGYPKEAVALLWLAADRPDLAFQALGSLARLYQVQRDAVGQYRAFGRLNAMRNDDRNIANNFAYFAALTDLGNQTQIERIAEDNFIHEPSDVFYRSTYAFVLVWLGQSTRAMTLMEPVSRDWRRSPVVAFAYGAALAGVGRKPEARQVFDSLGPRDLDPMEVDWIRSALR
jgi:hypothetical protein